jgi:hypothetical protein
MQGIHDILRKAAAEEDYKRILEAVSNGVSLNSIADLHPAAVLRSEWDYLSVINVLVVRDCKRIFIPRGARDAMQRVSDSKPNSANSQSTTRPNMIAGQLYLCRILMSRSTAQSGHAVKYSRVLSISRSQTHLEL